VKNDECTIYVMKVEKCINKFRKGKDSWCLTIASGRVFSCTCEQMVSHLLPALAFGSKKGIAIKVIPDKELLTQSPTNG
jgi:hypothetical protein